MLIRQVFNALSLRERYLVALIIWVVIFAWGLGLLKAFQQDWRTYSMNNQLLDSFEGTLAQSEEAEILLESAREGLDGTKTFSAAQLIGMLDSLARDNEVSGFDVSTPSTIDSQLFSFHTVRLSIDRSRISELIRFDQAVKAYSPYIALSEMQMNANKRDPRFLDAVFELVSFELKEEALND